VETDDQTFDLTLPVSNTPYVRAPLDPRERIVRRW
jgi:hypothetical protein